MKPRSARSLLSTSLALALAACGGGAGPADAGPDAADGEHPDGDAGSDPGPADDGGSGCEREGAGPAPIQDQLTGAWHLFLDDAAVSSREGLVRTYHALARAFDHPVMTATRPWGQRYVYTYGRVMHQPGGAGYRMWYSILDFADPDGGSRVAYAESQDGIAWSKPSLGIREYQGSTDNNLFIPRDRPNHILSVIYTPQDAGCPFKLINFDGAYGALAAGYDAACSQDGIHLVDLPNNPQVQGVGDVAQFTYDPWRGRYLGYVKVASEDDGYRRRTVGLLTTPDFRQWPQGAPPIVLRPDPEDDLWATSAGLPLATHRTHFYGVSVFPYQTLFLGFVWIFRAADPPGCGHDCEPYAGYIFGTIHVELVFSRDGESWHRIDSAPGVGRPPLLPLGPPGSWDSMMLFTANAPLLEGDTLKVYYGGCDEDHGRVGAEGGACAVGLATLRRDGFASLDAAGSGALTTRPLVGAQGALRVNAVVQPGGSLRAELQDLEGRALPGYALSDATPFAGDAVDAALAWGARSELPSSPCALRVRFVLERAALFSFHAGDGAAIAY